MLLIASVLIVIASIPLAMFLTTWGIDWISIGYGLHPLIAFPLVLICLLNIYVHGKLLIIDYNGFCLDQKNAAMREYLRLHKQTINKL